MSTAPFFSIVVPTYNRAHLLRDTINSVLSQVFRDFELVIVDDGSTDDTEKTVSALASGDSRISYLYQDNAERGAARNNGIRNAKGMFIVFFDSDDEMTGNYLTDLHNGIVAHPEYNFYAAKYNFIIAGKESESSISRLEAGEYGLDLLLEGNPFSCNFCIRTLNRNLILFRENKRLPLAEDWMFLVENLINDKIYLFDSVGVRMHEHEGRSMQLNDLLIACRVEATKELISRHSFSAQNTKTLWGYTYYFCSIHAYLDCKRSQSLRYIAKAIRKTGANLLFIKAACKYIAGRQLIRQIKRRL